MPTETHGKGRAVPLDRSLEPRVIKRIADILLPDPEDEIGWRLDEGSARASLEAAGVDPARIKHLRGDAILRDGLLIANEDPAVIERYLKSATHLLNGLSDPGGHDYMVQEIRAALQADGFDLVFSGNAAEVSSYVAPDPKGGRTTPGWRDKNAEIDRIIRWFERIAYAERALTTRRRAPDKHHAHVQYPIEDEYDLQDLFLAFLLLEYPLAHREDPTFAAAELSGRVDIVVPELDLYIELKYHDKSKDWSQTRKSISDKMMFYPDGIRCTTLLIAIFDSGFTLTKEIIEKDFAKTMKTPHGDVAIRAVIASRATS